MGCPLGWPVADQGWAGAGKHGSIGQLQADMARQDFLG